MVARMLCCCFGHALRRRLRGEAFRVCRRCGVHVWAPAGLAPTPAGGRR